MTPSSRAAPALAFRAGHARAPDWRDATEDALRQLGATPAGANLGFLYVADRLAGDATDILAHVRAATGVDNWVGTVGIGVLATGIEYMDEPAIALMIGAVPEGEFQVFSGKSRAPQLGGLTPSGAEAAHFAIVHGDPNTDGMPELIEDMSTKVASGYLVGGLSSSRAATVQFANAVLEGGLSGVVLSSRVDVVTRLTQGCIPLPARHVVTEGERNIIVSLDGRPALDVLREDIGEALGRDLRRAAQVIHAGLPVQGSDTGDYMVRNLVGFDPRNRLVAIGAEVEKGMPILFCKRDAISAREDLHRMLDSIAAELDGPPKGGLYYSCLGRGEHMFGRRSAELELIGKRLGDFPLVGFFCNGEISHDRLYGYTGVLTLFR
jgi:small ligand-binding sensory domain FIST